MTNERNNRRTPKREPTPAQRAQRESALRKAHEANRSRGYAPQREGMRRRKALERDGLQRDESPGAELVLAGEEPTPAAKPEPKPAAEPKPEPERKPKARRRAPKSTPGQDLKKALGWLRGGRD